MIKEIKFKLEKKLFLSYEGATEKDFHLAEQICFNYKNAIGKALMESIRHAEKTSLNINTYYKIPVARLGDTGNIHYLEFYLYDFDHEFAWIGLSKTIPKSIPA